MLHPATELRLVDPVVGYGVFATTPIPAGTLTWVLDSLDQVISPDRLENLNARSAALVEKYTWIIPSGHRILCWDFGRFMNHSCVPNCVTVDVDFEIAVRDIEIGEQLTNDYATLSLERPFACRCRQQGCRGRVYPQDIERLAAHYDRQVSAAMARLTTVAQPLLPWIHSRRTLDRWLHGSEPRRSILHRQVRPRAALAVAPKAHVK